MADVIYEKKGRLAYITLNRPGAMNAYTDKTTLELEQIWYDFRDDSELWVAIVTGAGEKAFCAGHDIRDIVEPQAPGVRPRDDLADIAPTLWYGDIEIYKPIIAAVNGFALGGGCSLALACDIRIASENAAFGYPQPKSGFMSLGGHQRLARMIPAGIAMEKMLTGDLIDAQEAYRLGLVNKVVPLAELMPMATKFAERLCQNAPLAVRAAKEASLRGQRLPLSEGVRVARDIWNRLKQSEDSKEGLQAFLEKRKPVWKGR